MTKILETLLSERKKFNVRIYATPKSSEKDVNMPLFANDLRHATQLANDIYASFVKDGRRVEVSSINEVKGSRYWSSELKKLEKRIFLDIPEYDDDDPDYDDLRANIKNAFSVLDKYINEI